MDADDIIDLLGGSGALAQRLGCAVSTVSMWRRQGIPPGRCLELEAIAKSAPVPGLTLDVLMRSMPRARLDADRDDIASPAGSRSAAATGAAT